MTGLTKFLGLPSLAALVLGGGLLLYSSKASDRYHNFIEKASSTNQTVRHVDSLDNALNDLFKSEKALTHYMTKPATVINSGRTTTVSPATYHNPSVNESLGDLASARNHIDQGEFLNNYEVDTLDSQIRLMQNELSRTEKGKPEKFYEPQRIELKGLQERASAELEELKKDVPFEILKERESLIAKKVGGSIGGWVFLILGGAGAISYGILRFTDPHYGY